MRDRRVPPSPVRRRAPSLFELYSPAAGTVAEINPALDADPAVVNRDPYGEGWMIALKLSDPAALDGLLTPAAYRSHIGE